MSIVQFAEICDKCKKRSEEYSRWNMCQLCGDDVCSECDVESHRDSEDRRTTCRNCFAQVSA